MSILLKRDFSAMHVEERKAIEGAKDAVPPMPSRSSHADDGDDSDDGVEKETVEGKYSHYLAIIPFSLMVVLTVVGMYITGYNEAKTQHAHPTIADIFQHSNSISALVWGALAACVVSFIMTKIFTSFTFNESLKAWLQGCEELVAPMIVLLLAWALGNVIHDVQVARYLSEALIEAGFSPGLLPAATGIMGYVISFACATSMGTQAILVPLIVPLAHRLGGPDLVTKCVGVVFGSTIFGNVCSPIADTSILITISTGCDLKTHIKTTISTSVLVALISTIFADLPVGFGLYSQPVGLCICFAVVTVIVWFAGISPDSKTGQSKLGRYLANLYGRMNRLNGSKHSSGGVSLKRKCETEGTEYSDLEDSETSDVDRAPTPVPVYFNNI